MEGAAYKVRVNCIIPGWVNTPASTEFAHGDQGMIQAIGASIPMGRMGEPDELAAGIVFLCSDDAAFITGQTVLVDGGYTKKPF